MVTQRITFLIFCTAFLAPMVTHAATWRVEEHGAPYFGSIHDAVAVAADGDTILIGPGTFDDYRPVRPPGWGYDVYCLAWVWDGRDLTFRGAGQDETILGNDSTDPFDWHYAGLFTRYARIVVEDLRIKRNYSPIYGGGGGTDGLRISRCYLDGCAQAVFNWSVEPVEVYDCTFNILTTGFLLHTPTYFHVARCKFTKGGYAGVDIQDAGATFLIEDCVFDEIAGVVVWGAIGTIRNCSFSRSTMPGMAISINSRAQVELQLCTIETMRHALAVTDRSQVVASQCTFRGGGAPWSTLYFGNSATANIHNCDILNGGGDSVYTIGYDCTYMHHIDLTGNYWGTTEAEQIESWIHYDHESGPNCSVVDYVPFAGSSVPTEPQSWGGVKALFR